MGFQITSALFAALLTFLGSVSLMMHGRWNYFDDEKYDPEIGGRIACAFVIFGSIALVSTCIFISVQFCRATCCARSRVYILYSYIYVLNVVR